MPENPSRTRNQCSVRFAVSDEVTGVAGWSAMVGLRMFALMTLDEKEHRRFLVLDEQDCWLHPDLVPRLVKMVHEAGQALGFQVLMISHHDSTRFEQFADRIYRLGLNREGGIEAELLVTKPTNPDG